jgi:hypothetical protein
VGPSISLGEGLEVVFDAVAEVEVDRTEVGRQEKGTGMSAILTLSRLPPEA